MEQQQRPAWRTFLDVTATVMMIAASGAVGWIALFAAKPKAPPVGPSQALSTASVPPRLVTLDDAAVMGSREAPVVVIEYSDFECPFCAVFSHETLPSVIEKHIRPGRVQFAFRHLPLQTRHPNAFGAAEGAECCRRQGRFWEMHDSLFSRPLAMGSTDLISRARAIGVDVTAFQACLAGAAAGAIRADIEQAKRLGVSATPTFFFGRRRPDGQVALLHRQSGAITQDVFDRLVKEATDWLVPE